MEHLRQDLCLEKLRLGPRCSSRKPRRQLVRAIHLSDAKTSETSRSFLQWRRRRNRHVLSAFCRPKLCSITVSVHVVGHVSQNSQLLVRMCRGVIMGELLGVVASGVPRRRLEPLPLAYGLRNKRDRMHQNMVFSTKNTRSFLRRGPAPLHLPTSHPLGACGISTPPIVKFWVRHWPWPPNPPAARILRKQIRKMYQKQRKFCAIIISFWSIYVIFCPQFSSGSN